MTKPERIPKLEVQSDYLQEDAFWLDDEAEASSEESPSVREGPDSAKIYDLEERTALFGEAIIRFAKRIPLGPGNNRLIDQVVGAGTSVGANYCEADDAVSKKEFLVNINRCRKESRETKFFLRMIACAEPDLKNDARILWREAKELNLIFSAIFKRKNGK